MSPTVARAEKADDCQRRIGRGSKRRIGRGSERMPTGCRPEHIQEIR